ncbi:la-related protein 7 [Athalia rosae]|uniref:la-related protein 7 n=1 Tax=Athalia rosae TaxID=37344 RepID=UPI0020347E83|nr:la-related protein 7 [Athalia rosae]
MVMEEEQSHMELASESVPVPRLINSVEPINNDENIDPPKKKPRFRKKALHAAIRKQMEFYFGNSNLMKDRFLGNLTKKDPYVDLDIFLRFNKIRALTTDVNAIVRALQKSEMLSVSEDGTKVCRVTPILPKENIDECTIYVQRLPLNADHEWLTNVFSQYGAVAYVSIPRYQSNKRIKGFAFVEFEEPSSAAKCIEEFREKGCVLPSQTSPESLLSITTFHEQEALEKNAQLETNHETADINHEAEGVKLETVKSKIQQKASEESMEVSNDDAEFKTDTRPIQVEIDKSPDLDVSKLGEKEITSKKQKHKNSEMEDNDEKLVEQRSKKQKTLQVSKEDQTESPNEDIDKQNEASTDSEKEKKSKKRKQRSSLTTKHKEVSESVEEKNDTRPEKVNTDEFDEVFIDNQAADEKDQKKKRKRTRHNRSEKLDTADIGMQIMAKKDWKILRNKYLDLQRSKMKSLKAHLKRARWNQWNNYEKFRESDKCKVVKEENIENRDEPKTQKSAERFTFTPGVIVRVELDEPCTDTKSFKMELKRNPNIKYIDIIDGASLAFLRCDTREAAKALVLQSNEERSMSILQDTEEAEYWKKMSRDREEKLGNKVRVKQRGRDKLLKKAEKELGKHIKFDEV